MNQTVEALNALSIFGPHQAGAYREHAAFSASILGDDISTLTQTHIDEWATSRKPGTLVLTGNAGTGKTALAQLFCGAYQASLPDVDSLVEISDSAFVVKDFSGIRLEDRAQVLKLESEIRNGRSTSQLFICANEGVLRDSLTSADDEFGRAVSSALETGAQLVRTAHR